MNPSWLKHHVRQHPRGVTTAMPVTKPGAKSVARPMAKATRMPSRLIDPGAASQAGPVSDSEGLPLVSSGTKLALVSESRRKRWLAQEAAKIIPKPNFLKICDPKI